MSQSTNSASRFNWMQRTIQAVFGTREFAVVSLVLFCVIVEACILIATQRYESLTAPTGTVLFWGMSAAGMVIFFAELLKLPVAWISGVVSGKRMVVLNLVTGGLCLLTALTIKDLVIWEWDAALKPAREMRDQAKAVETEIAALESSGLQLTEVSKEADELRQAKITVLKKLLDDQVRRRNEDLSVFRERLTALNRNLLDPAIQNQILALEKSRDSSAATFKTDIESLQKHLDSLETQARERSQAQRTDAKEAFERTTTKREALYKEYELARQQVIAKRDAEIEKLGEDGPFRGVASERVRLRNEAEQELRRLETDYKSNVAALSGAGDLEGLADTSREISMLRQQITTKQLERDQRLATLEGEIRELQQRAAKVGGAATELFAKQTREIEIEMTAKVREHDVKIREYENQLSLVVAEGKLQKLSPQEIEARQQAIATQLPELKKKADGLRTESNRLAKDTNAFRAANGVIRWVLPDAPIERLEEIAYGVFPLLIALLVSFLPAVLLEIGVYCVRPEVRRAERARPSILARLSRGRRVLRELRARAHERMTAAEAALRECRLVREKLDLEHASRSNGLDKEVDQKIEAAITELQTRTSELEASLQEARIRESRFEADLSNATQQAIKHHKDNLSLMAQVARLDAAVHRQG
jgi:DNA repair exonuclease SbcCD ATPase subunit